MKCDVVVIGGGPAGMIAAARAAKRGAQVVLLEKNDNFGKKLLITGKGRCNITNTEDDIHNFVKRFGHNGKFLYSALSRFNSEDVVSFFNKIGVKTKVERGGRIFPVSDSAIEVRDALLDFLKKNRVITITQSRVSDVVIKENKIRGILINGEIIKAQNYIICTGGLSYPATGSTGDGFDIVKKFGHNITKLRPALTSIILSDAWVSEVAGLSLKNVSIIVYADGKKQDERMGEAMFTHKGISGPIVIDMSKNIGELLEKEGAVSLFIDFKPALDFEMLDKRIQRDWQEDNNKDFKNSLNKLLPQSIIPVIVKLSGIDADKKVNSITREERRGLIHLLKGFRMNVKGLTGFDDAIVTAGGVSLSEVDPKTMKSKIVDNLYFAGEILDLDGPTGGYNLQVCWSTGFVAGDSVNF